MALASAGCLVTDTPKFDPPQRIGPFLTNLVPSTEQPGVIYLVPGTDPRSHSYLQNETINFDVVSEDLGDKLTVLILIDFKGFDSPDINKVCEPMDLPPGTLAGKPRPVTCRLALPPSVERGCHPITALVSHAFVPLSARPVVLGDVALATWFYQVGVDTSETNPEYWACEPRPTPADAGVDANPDRGAF
jgi:hypothetical protein